MSSDIRRNSASPNIVPIVSIDDPRIDGYRNLKDRELARDGGRFIAEGEHVVRRLLASNLQTESLLLSTRRAEEIAHLASPQTPVYVADSSIVNSIIGFKFHSGVMAIGLRPATPTVATLGAALPERAIMMVLPETNNTENLGSMIRIAAAFGAAALVLGPLCCDPFYRQAVRVSMGTVFSLPVIRSSDLLADLDLLRKSFGFELWATVLHPQAQPLSSVPPHPRVAVLFGNEGQGLSREHAEACDRQVIIPMQLGTDSLNVAVCAGVVMYQLQHGLNSR
jgi:tRNA G18 (ribose-2'-O)-methylase SpoU